MTEFQRRCFDMVRKEGKGNKRGKKERKKKEKL